MTLLCKILGHKWKLDAKLFRERMGPREEWGTFDPWPIPCICERCQVKGDQGGPGQQVIPRRGVPHK